MKLLATLALAAGFAFAPNALAQDAEAIKAALRKKFPDAPIEGVRKVPYGNLFEVTGGGEILYTDANTTFLIVGGQLIDARTRENMTELRMRQVNAIKFDTLPLESAIKITRGTGARKIAIFEDPNCGYCKRIERELAAVPDLTVYVFLYPILSPDSTEKAKQVWCSPDRQKAWLDLMLKDTRPTAVSTCDNPIEKVLAFGQARRINATPTIVFEDGDRVAGMLAPDAFETKLKDAAKPVKGASAK